MDRQIKVILNHRHEDTYIYKDKEELFRTKYENYVINYNNHIVAFNNDYIMYSSSKCISRGRI